VKIYMEKILATFSDFHQTIFSFLAVHSQQQLFSQLTAHSSFFHSHSSTKQTLIISQLSQLCKIILIWHNSGIREFESSRMCSPKKWKSISSFDRIERAYYDSVADFLFPRIRNLGRKSWMRLISLNLPCTLKQQDVS
jgi:hypothetical protein